MLIFIFTFIVLYLLSLLLLPSLFFFLSLTHTAVASPHFNHNMPSLLFAIFHLILLGLTELKSLLLLFGDSIRFGSVCRLIIIPRHIFENFVNSLELLVHKTSGLLSGCKSECALFIVSCAVFVVHGKLCIHWNAKSCTTTRISMLQSWFVLLIENSVIRPNCVHEFLLLVISCLLGFRDSSWMEFSWFLRVCKYHIWGLVENDWPLCLPPDLFEGLAAICGGGVLGSVSPPLPDDPDSPPTSPSEKSDASLEYLALGLPKLSALGLPTSGSSGVNMGDCALSSMCKNTHFLREIFLARVRH